MQTEMVSGLLLPLGIWLILSAGAPNQLHRRLAAASLIAIAVATLAFVAFGFAFMFGDVESSSGWLFVGTRGFFLNGATDQANLDLFVTHLPPVLTCALLLAGVFAPRARTTAGAILVAVIAGIIFPIIGCWLWGGGWLSNLGRNANLGQGVIDLGKLAAIGLVAGAAGLAWLAWLAGSLSADWSSQREPMFDEPELPAAHFPIRAVAGVLCALASTSASAAASSTAASSPPSSTLALGQFVNSSIAVSAAILAAGVYTIFTTRKTDVLSASRAALAAMFLTSSGGALLPMWTMVVLGVGCGLLATIGYYVINEGLRLQDDSAITTSVFIPAAIGMLATGLLANGASGIAGLLPQEARSDPGQLAAQIVGLITIPLLAFVACGVTLVLARRAQVQLLVPSEMIYAQSPDAQSQPSQPLTTTSTTEATSDAATLLPKASVTNVIYVSTSESVAAGATNAHDGADEKVDEKPTQDGLVRAPSATNQRKGLLGWLRRAAPVQLSPKQPRKVAYPHRVGGRRLTTRPLMSEGSNDSNAPPQDSPA